MPRGTVTAANDALAADPALVNRAADKDGWFFKLKLANAAELEGLLESGGDGRVKKELLNVKKRLYSSSEIGRVNT